MASIVLSFRFCSKSLSSALSRLKCPAMEGTSFEDGIGPDMALRIGDGFNSPRNLVTPETRSGIVGVLVGSLMARSDFRTGKFSGGSLSSACLSSSRTILACARVHQPFVSGCSEPARHPQSCLATSHGHRRYEWGLLTSCPSQLQWSACVSLVHSMACRPVSSVLELAAAARSVASSNLRFDPRAR